MDKQGTSVVPDLPRKALGGVGLDELGKHLRGHSDHKVVPGWVNAESGPSFHPVRRLLTLLSTTLRLGVANGARATIHRIYKRAGIYRSLLPAREAVGLEFLNSSIGIAGLL